MGVNYFLMKKNLIILMAIFLMGFLGYLNFAKQEKKVMKNFPPKNETILIFGDSLTQGFGSTAGNDFPTLLSKKIKKPVLNRGRNGDTTEDALSRLDRARGEKPGLAIVALGANDFMQRLPEKETFDNLEKIVEAFQSDGAAVVLLGVRSDVFGIGKGDKYVALAEKTGSVYLPDMLKDVFGKSQYMSDAVHPNDAGYEIVAQRVFLDIKDLYRQ
jgi:lysophospholipase L1-like esterase